MTDSLACLSRAWISTSSCAHARSSAAVSWPTASSAVELLGERVAAGGDGLGGRLKRRGRAFGARRKRTTALAAGLHAEPAALPLGALVLGALREPRSAPRSAAPRARRTAAWPSSGASLRELDPARCAAQQLVGLRLARAMPSARLSAPRAARASVTSARVWSIASRASASSAGRARRRELLLPGARLEHPLLATGGDLAQLARARVEQARLRGVTAIP